VYICVLSVTSLLFWIAAVGQSLRVFTESWEAAWRIGWFMLVTVVPALAAGGALRFGIASHLGDTQAASAALVALVATACLAAAVVAQWAFNRSYALELYHFIKDGFFGRRKGAEYARGGNVAS